MVTNGGKDTMAKNRKFLFHAGHPAHVHLLRNAIKKLRDKGYEVLITVIEKDVSIRLLDSYELPYTIIGQNVVGLANKILNSARIEKNLYGFIREHRPHILVGVGSPYLAHVGFITGIPYLNFGDTEMSKFDWTWTPFASVMIRPAAYKKEIGNREIRYDGYHEIAYLHPAYFTPDPSVYADLGLSKGDPYIILRLISSTASHDIGFQGIAKNTEDDIIKKLSEYGHIFITSERKLGNILEKYRVAAAPEKMHSILHYANLYFGDGGKSATEAAILGTPSIHIESAPDGSPSGETSGVFMELRNRYDLLYFYAKQQQGLEKAIELLDDNSSKRKWLEKRDILFKEKINVTDWMTDFIERYPESYAEQVQMRK